MPTRTPIVRPRRTRDALAHTVSAETWRRAFVVRPADATLAVSVRVGLAATLVLVVFGLTGHGDVAGLAVLSALTSAFARHDPLRRTAEKVGSVGILVVSSVLVGGLIALAGLPVWAQIASIAVLSGAAAAVLAAFRIAGPGPVILVFAATAAVGSTASAADLAVALVSSTVGATVGLGVALVPLLFLPWGPARLAVARALAAAAAVPAGADPAAARDAITSAREKLVLTATSTGHTNASDLAAILGEADAALDEWELGDPRRLDEVVRHEAELRKAKRHRTILGAGTGAPPLPRPPSFVAVGVAGLRTRAVTEYAARIVVASAVAGWLAAELGFDHPLWASMGAMAAMQGVTYGQTVQRAIQRLLGNVGGAVIAAALIALSLGYWQCVVIIAVLQVAAEVTATRNYALCSLFVTPMALLVIGLGATVDTGTAVSRVVDTLVGVVVGVIVAAVTISRADRAHLAGR
ncbi:FUSC family protein [Rhodococcus sp. NPDC058505]|uniref:FUSC family protein n=1 Tax=unclassified Rhodococcus (in: high G+C Gram-positive bacteria) TaxID=192944 RepID=UPI00364C829F